MNQTDKRYKDLVEEFEAMGPGIVEEPICYFDNWYEISWEEAKEFGIDPYLNNRLWLAYTRYQNMLGITDSGIWTDEDEMADRASYGRMYGLQENESVVHDVCTARFMSEVCNLPYQDCYGYLFFIHAAMDRAGLITRSAKPLN